MRRTLLTLALLATAAHTARAQDPLTTYPANYKQIFSNEEVSVVHVHYGPHEKLGLHNHSNYPTVYVYLSDSGPVRFSHDEEIPAFVMTRPAVKAGSLRVSPGRIERHTVENLGDQPSDYLRIELKHLPLHSTLHPQRIPAPDHLEPGIQEAFDSPELSIHRIVCNLGQTCKAASSKSPILLVAFTPITATTKTPIPSEKSLQSNEVLWLEHPESLAITPAIYASAHLLQIELHDPR
jgi:hypothetical protein